jgi:molybdopterin-guanine dinucleotide biosynthesis protein A
MVILTNHVPHRASNIQHPASSQHPAMRKGAIILCGGKSSRMGRDKATLPFGPERMLQRIVRLISQVVEPSNLVVVAARNQSLPELPRNVVVTRDVHEYRGPLEGLSTGLSALADRVDAAYATGCDVPLLVPAFVDRMFELLGDFDTAVPFDGEHHHPLAAVYRSIVLARVQKLLDAQRMRPRFLFDEVRTREIPVDELRAVDPQLTTLENLNYEKDYLNALAAAGLTIVVPDT